MPGDRTQESEEYRGFAIAPYGDDGKRPMRKASGGYSRAKGKPGNGSTSVSATARIGADLPAGYWTG